jgi:hypothetical protein
MGGARYNRTYREGRGTGEWDQGVINLEEKFISYVVLSHTSLCSRSLHRCSCIFFFLSYIYRHIRLGINIVNEVKISVLDMLSQITEFRRLKTAPPKLEQTIRRMFRPFPGLARPILLSAPRPRISPILFQIPSIPRQSRGIAIYGIPPFSHSDSRTPKATVTQVTQGNHSMSNRRQHKRNNTTTRRIWPPSHRARSTTQRQAAANSRQHPSKSPQRRQRNPYLLSLRLR